MEKRFKKSPFKKSPAGSAFNVKKLYHKPRRKFCRFCYEKLEDIDWKNVKVLKKYVSEVAKIIPSNKTGTCAKHQKKLQIAVKRARIMALLPFTIHQLQGSMEE